MNRPGSHVRGQVIVLFCFALVVLMGFLALAVDVGMLWTTRRQMQTAADAAAIAGANHCDIGSSCSCGSGSACATAATEVATMNGYSSGVTVGTPNPAPSAGSGPYVQVSIAQAVPTYFMGVFGSSWATVNVNTQAVAGYINGISDGGIVTLDTSSSNNSGITVSGGSTLSTSAGIIVDAGGSQALDASGGSIVNAASIGVVGTVSGTTTPAAQTGIQPMPDPLSYLQAPTYSGCTYGSTSTQVKLPCNKGQTLSATTELCVNNPPSGSQTPAPTSYTLNPGVYCQGITVNGNGISATFNSGLYVLEGGGLNIQGGASGTGTGVTFFNTGTSTYQYKPIVVSASSASLSAPTSGGDATAEACCSTGYEGILFWQDPSICTVNSNNCGASSQQNTISGGSTAAFVGALYFPNTPLVYSGGSASAAYTIIVAYTLTVSGGSTTYLNSNTSGNQDGSPIKQTALYE
jgi:hypothetical protein